MLDFISVCAGIGGIDLGFESVGMRCVAQIEIDDYATKILEARWPNIPRFRDIRRTSARTLPSAQVLAGGIPCQPHSVSGKRQGMHDERDLWPEFFRLLVNTQPRYAVIENVVGITTSNNGEHFGRILKEMAAAGYDAEWVRLRASQIGARHRRERVWIVAYPTGDKLQGRSLRAAQRGQNTRKNNYQDYCSLVLKMRYPLPEFSEAIMGFQHGWTHPEIKQ